MNPRLVKFAVELQNAEKTEKNYKYVQIKYGSVKNFFNILKPAKVTVPVDRVD